MPTPPPLTPPHKGEGNPQCAWHRRALAACPPRKRRRQRETMPAYPHECAFAFFCATALEEVVEDRKDLAPIPHPAHGERGTLLVQALIERPPVRVGLLGRRRFRDL